MAQPNGPNPTSTPTPAPTSRTRALPTGDEEAGSILSLGEFQHSAAMSTSEARILVHAVRSKRPEHLKTAENDQMVKMQDYLDEFSRFKQQPNVEAVDAVIGNKGFEFFERAQVGTLLPESAEEAKTLIPSLANKISDADLDDLLKEVTNLRAFAD